MNKNFKRILFSACLLAALGGTACSDESIQRQLVEVQRVEKLRNLEVKIILMDLCRWIR